MKYVKMLGLAAVAAAALMAFVGAGTASAVTLCTTDEPGTTSCTGASWEISTITASQKNTSGILEDTSSNTLITCTESHLHADVTNGGGAGTPASGPVTELKFGGCNSTPVVLKKGSLSINSSRVVSSSGGEITATLFGVSCNYATAATGTALGTLAQGSDTLVVNAVINKSSGGFLCPSTTKWTTTFTITNHSAVYVTTQ